jgi:heavy metal translocating P-type ATPase
MTAASAPSSGCDYCGLPLPRPLLGRTADDCSSDTPRYCCFGCRLAAGVTGHLGEAAAARGLLCRLGLGLFFAMNVMVFTLVLWSFDIYDTSGSPPAASLLKESLRWLGLVGTVPVLFLLGQPLAVNAIEDLRRRVPSTDLLLLTGVIAAFLYSVISLTSGRGSVYFETVCMVLVFVTLGRWFEASGRQQAASLLDELQQLLPETAQRVDGGRVSEVALNAVRTGDRLQVHAGERFPADGRLHSATASVDEQLFTGESWPVSKQAGDELLAGTLNLDATVHLIVTATPDSGALSRMMQAVRDARNARGRYHRLADRVAGSFFPVIALIALATLTGHLLSGHGEHALLAALSVVLVACPCALGIATPLAVWSALSRAAGSGVLFRSGEAVEKLADTRCLFFDKTGTLTTGAPRMQRFAAAAGVSRDDVLARSAVLAAGSRHPFSRAIVQFAEVVGQPAQCGEVRIESGLGLAGRFQGEADETLLGSPELFQMHGYECDGGLDSLSRASIARGAPVTQVGWDGRVRGVFVFQEDLRAEAAQALSDCAGLGIPVEVLTGDHAVRGQQLATELRVPVRAGLAPEQKQAAIRIARERQGPVAMVGDGLNDAPALLSADVGLAMGCGADLTRDAGDVCLLGNSLERVPWAVALARQTVRIVRQNLAWAFGYNAIGVAIAAGGWLHPALAAALMLGSSLIVIVNSLRLRRFSTGQRQPLGEAARRPEPHAAPARGWTQEILLETDSLQEHER